MRQHNFHGGCCPTCGRAMGSMFGGPNPKQTWIQFLGKIVAAKQSLTLSQVADLTGSTRGNSYNRLKRLEGWGMVRKSKTTRGTLLYTVTPHGIETLRKKAQK